MPPWRALEFDDKTYQMQVDKLHELRGKLMQKKADVVKRLAKEFNQNEQRSSMISWVSIASDPSKTIGKHDVSHVRKRYVFQRVETCGRSVI